MTIYVPWWGFLAAAAFIVSVLALGFAAGRAERRGRRDLAAAERAYADEDTRTFATPSWMEPVAGHGRMPVNPGYPPPPPIDLAAYDDDSDVPWPSNEERPVDHDDDEYPRGGLAGDIGRDIEEGMDVEDDDGGDEEEPGPQQDRRVAVVVSFQDIAVGGRAIRTGVAYAVPAQPWCRRGALIGRLAARAAPLADWVAERRAAWGVDRTPTWQPGEVRAIGAALRHRHEGDGTSEQAEEYEPKHAGETKGRRPSFPPDWSPIPLMTRRLLAPTAFTWRRHQLAARAAVRQFLARVEGRAA